MSGAHVLPVFFPGRNSLLFNLLGLLHPRLRTLMLPREMLARQSTRFRLYIGKRLSFERMRLFEDDKSLNRWLRFNTYFMANRLPEGTHLKRRAALPQKDGKKPQELISPVSTGLLSAAD